MGFDYNVVLTTLYGRMLCDMPSFPSNPTLGSIHAISLTRKLPKKVSTLRIWIYDQSFFIGFESQTLRENLSCSSVLQSGEELQQWGTHFTDFWPFLLNSIVAVQTSLTRLGQPHCSHIFRPGWHPAMPNGALPQSRAVMDRLSGIDCRSPDLIPWIPEGCGAWPRSKSAKLTD